MGDGSREFVAWFELSAAPWFDCVDSGVEVIVATDWGSGSGFRYLGTFRGGGDIEALRLRAKRSCSIALRSRPSIEVFSLGGGTGTGRGGVSPSVVVSSSLLGSVACSEMREGVACSSSVVASSSLSRFMTSLGFDDEGF